MVNIVSTLKQTSYDDANKVYLSESELQVIDFDKYTEQLFFDKYLYELNDNQPLKPKSVDTFCLIDGNYCLIEFKNDKIDSNIQRDIREKIGHSVATILFEEKITPQSFRNTAHFILVYSKEKDQLSRKLVANEMQVSNNRFMLTATIAKKTSISNVFPKLYMFREKYFKTIDVFDQYEFATYISKHAVTLPDSIHL